MDDLISRKALLEKAQYEEIWTGEDEYCWHSVSVEDIENAPAVDAVEVIRCKDCKRRYFNEDNERYCCDCWADGYDTAVDNDDFCSRGERKENEADKL